VIVVFIIKSEKVPSSKRDLAIKELKDMIATSLSPKLEELKTSLNAKLSAQDEVFTQKLKKLDEEQKKDAKKTGKK
jgi:hypothetical protein